ncbi:MAG: hypothetical protein H6644_16850 [Caldilineaceae bacterium]|nr:hypothetical protein [Caldilineaceae bacterium]
MDDQIPFHPHVQAVLAAIRQLSPDARRRLQRRLRVSGLLVQDELLTDQNRLRVAPALGERPPGDNARPARAGRGPALPRKTCMTNHPHAPAAPSAAGRQANTGDRAETATAEPAHYESPIRGKVVVGGPGGRPMPIPM